MAFTQENQARGGGWGQDIGEEEHPAHRVN